MCSSCSPQTFHLHSTQEGLLQRHWSMLLRLQTETRTLLMPKFRHMQHWLFLQRPGFESDSGLLSLSLSLSPSLSPRPFLSVSLYKVKQKGPWKFIPMELPQWITRHKCYLHLPDGSWRSGSWSMPTTNYSYTLSYSLNVFLLCNDSFWSHDIYCFVHPGEGSSSVALLKGSSLFSLWKGCLVVFLIRCKLWEWAIQNKLNWIELGFARVICMLFPHWVQLWST